MQDLPKLPSDLPKLPSLSSLPKLPKLPSLEERRKVPIEQEPDIPPPSVAPKAPQENAKDVDNFGWLKNYPESAFNYVKSVVYDLPKAAIASAIYYAQNPEQYTKDLNLLFTKNNGLGHMFKEQMVDYYAKDFWKNFNEDPVHALSDAATILSLGGGAITKLGNLGKAAAVARAGMSARPAVKALQGVAAAGKAIAATETYLDPLVYAGKAATKVAGPALTALGFGKYTERWGGERANLAAGHSINLHNEVNSQILRDLNPAENAQMERLTSWGDVKEIETVSALDTAQNKVAKQFRVWRDIVTGGDESVFKEIGTLDDSMARNANATRASEYSKNHFHELGLQKPVTPKEALDLMDHGIINPTFMSTYRIKPEKTVFDMLNKPTYRGGVWSRFERLSNNNAPKVTDMATIMARQIAMRHDALYRLDLLAMTKNMMNEVGETIFVGKGKDHFGVPNTHAPLQDPFYRKYWTDMITAGDVNVQFLSNADSPIHGLAAAKEALESNPEIAKAIADEGQLYVPKHIAALLNRELAPISDMARMYDSVLGQFKGLATVFNPRFWGSVLAGNTILGLFYGVSPDVARIAYKYRGNMPAELRQLGRTELWLKDQGVYSRVANSLGEAAQFLDSVYRLPIFASEVGKEMRARSLDSAKRFFMTSDEVAKAIVHYGGSPDRLLKNRLAIEKLQMAISQHEPQLLKLQATLKDMEPHATAAAALKRRIYKPEDAGWVAQMDLLDRYSNLEKTYKELLERQTQKLADLGALQRNMPELIRDAAVADRAINTANSFYGSYARLSPFERKVLRRVLPFYTFNKAMTMLAFRLPFTYPKRVFIGAHLAQAWFDMTEDENSFMPLRLKNYVPVAARPDGSVVAISTGMMNPMGGARAGSVADVPIPTAFNPLQSHPVIQLILKMNGSTPEWSSKPLSPGDYATRLDNGMVVKWTGEGFKTVIAQPSLMKSLFDLFPQSQLIDKLLHRYAQSDRGWLFNPDPLLGPDGKPRYPKELQDVLLGMVIPTQTYNVDEVKRAEQAKMYAVMRSYWKELRYATPTKREQILEVLRSWKDEKNRKWIQ